MEFVYSIMELAEKKINLIHWLSGISDEQLIAELEEVRKKSITYPSNLSTDQIEEKLQASE